MGRANTVYFSYPSFDELVERAHDETDFPLNRRESRNGMSGAPCAENGDGNSSEWHGATWQDASDWARHGDIEGARKLKADVLKATNALLHDRPRLDPVYRVDEGQWIDISRYIKGEPEAWGALVDSETMTPRRGVSVIINASYGAWIKAKDIEAVGIEVGGTILALQALGYAVTLYVNEAIGGNVNRYVVSAPINPGGTPLDMAKVSTILRPWFLRRILFSLEETYAEKTRRDIGVGSGYGHPSNIDLEDAKEFTLPGTIPVIMNMDNFIRNPGAAQKHLLESIKKGNK